MAPMMVLRGSADEVPPTAAPLKRDVDGTTDTEERTIPWGGADSH
jgi:hypothetical protein